jgi:hypothetical protein
VRRRENFLDLHPLHTVAELLAIDLITVAQEVGGRGVVRERGDDLRGGPNSGRVLRDVEVWTTRRRWWASTTRTNNTRRRAVGTVKKSMGTKSRTW